MSYITEIQFDEDGLRLWTVGSDDFYIEEDDFKKVRKAMREYTKKKSGVKK